MRYGGVSWWMPEVFLLQVMEVLWRALVTLFWYGYNIGGARTFSTCLRHHESVNMAALKKVHEGDTQKSTELDLLLKR